MSVYSFVAVLQHKFQRHAQRRNSYRVSNPFLVRDDTRTGMLAWLTVDDERVALLDGYSAASYTPPSLFFASSAMPGDFERILRKTKVCTLSMATTRESQSSFQEAASSNWTQRPTCYSFDDLGLKPAKTKAKYPSVISTSPIHMHCSLENCVTLTDEGDGKGSEGGDCDTGSEYMIVLVVESFVIDGSILSPPTEILKKRPNVVAKIDAELIQPVVSVGHGGTICPLKEIHTMPRPVKFEDENSPTKWTSTNFNLAEKTLGPGGYDTVEWNFREHGGTSPLGYSATTALIMPRPIGWISTYHVTSSNEKLNHLAPYSFFSNISRSLQRPMVAFSGYQKDGEPKDAQNDAQRSGYFVYNMVTEDLAVRMNLSAAELPREESEFAISGLEVQEASLVDAPTVRDSPIRLECKYIKSIPIGSFCLVLGQVVGIGVARNVVTDQQIDVTKLKAITRLGFMDEYGTLDISS